MQLLRPAPSILDTVSNVSLGRMLITQAGFPGNRRVSLAALLMMLAGLSAALPAHADEPKTCAEYVRQVLGPDYVLERTEPTGNGGTRCYHKHRNDKEKAVSYSIVWSEEPAMPEAQEQPTGNTGAPATGPDAASAASQDKAKACNYEFRQSAQPAGGDPLSDLLCGAVSSDSPSFLVYPIGKDGKLGKQLTEVDALRGKTWYECKCGYLSTVRGAIKGTQKDLLRFTGPSGIDKKIRAQKKLADECGYDYRLVVANPEVEAYFRQRYADVTVVAHAFEPCE
jgi:hypothetical protein